MSDRRPIGTPGAEAPPTWFLDGSACPSWCTQGHLRALREGNSVEAQLSTSAAAQADTWPRFAAPAMAA